MRRTALLGLLALLPGCAEVQGYGEVAIQARRTMNDMQARATMAATCDIALGAYFRELSALERQYVGLICGGVPPASAPAAVMGAAPGVMAAQDAMVTAGAAMDPGVAPAP